MDQEELQRLKNLKGEMRGDLLKTDAAYVLKTKGKEGVIKLQQATRELGWEIDYANLKSMSWYPIGLQAISLLAAQKAFGWGEKEVLEMGNVSPKYTIVTTMAMKYFVSLKQVIKEMPKYYRMHFNVGSLEPAEYDEKKKNLVIRLKDFNVHPLICLVIIGYIKKVAQFVIKSKNITIEETKCVHKGDPYHEFSIKWE